MGLHSLLRLQGRICPFLLPPFGPCCHLPQSLCIPLDTAVPEVISLILCQQVLGCTKSLLLVIMLSCFTQRNEESDISRLDI